jgi:hypothetical protein
MRNLLAVNARLAAAVLVGLALCGCDASWEDGRSKEIVKEVVAVVTTRSINSSSRTDAVEVLVGAENHVCSIYPDDNPELFIERTLVHKVYWRAMGQHAFKITFTIANWPFLGPGPSIDVPIGGRSKTYYVNPGSAGGDIPYTVTYDNNQPCTSYIPDQNAMGIHITK